MKKKNNLAAVAQIMLAGKGVSLTPWELPAGSVACCCSSLVHPIHPSLFPASLQTELGWLLDDALAALARPAGGKPDWRLTSWQQVERDLRPGGPLADAAGQCMVQLREPLETLGESYNGWGLLASGAGGAVASGCVRRWMCCDACPKPRVRTSSSAPCRFPACRGAVAAAARPAHPAAVPHSLRLLARCGAVRCGPSATTHGLQRGVQKQQRCLPSCCLRCSQSPEAVPTKLLSMLPHNSSPHPAVGPGVLIARPETELMIDFVQEAVAANPALAAGAWADLGTGSGALAVGVARALPQAQQVRGRRCYVRWAGTCPRGGYADQGHPCPADLPLCSQPPSPAEL